jgi:RHS repeat-associated protein
MGVVNYTKVNGELLAENRDNVRRWYVPDLLGSAVALLDNTQTQTDTFSYCPFGEERTRTGTTATPFRFVGTWMYYRDSLIRTYVVARELRTDQGRWMTVERTSYETCKYCYVDNGPVSWIDPDG